MSVLITGVAGFIGSFLARKLLKMGIDVIGIDNFDDYYSKKAKEFNLDLISFSCGSKVQYFNSNEIENIYRILHEEKSKSPSGKFEFAEIDILDRQVLEQLVKRNRFDAIFHLAALGGVPVSLEIPERYTEVNVLGTVNLLNLCAKFNINKFVFASSSSVYGENENVPFLEIEETDRPISPYASTKKASEVSSYVFSKVYGMDISILRFFTVYGPLQRPKGMAIQKFIKQAYLDKPMSIYGDGSMARDYVYIYDLIDGIVSAFEKNKGYNIYNLAGGKAIDLNFLTKIISSNLKKGRGVYISSPKTEVPVTFADISKAEKFLEYHPSTSFEEGIAKQIKVFAMMPEWYKKLDD